jgi:hypothetical protein
VADLGFAAAGTRAREDQSWIDRVTLALIFAGGQVALEPDPQTHGSDPPLPYTLQQYQRRSTLAVNVLQNPIQWGRLFAWIVMFHPDALGGWADDEQLIRIIYWEWNAVSGAGPAIVDRPDVIGPPTPPDAGP